MAPKSNISVALHAETRGNKTYIKLKYRKVTLNFFRGLQSKMLQISSPADLLG